MKKVLLAACAAFVLPLTAVMAGPVGTASADPSPSSPVVVYDATTNPLVPMVSEAFEATSTSEFGNEINFATGQRLLSGATVTMDSWACQSGGWANQANNCVTTPGATFSEPVTLNLYSVGVGNTVGPQISSTTQTFNIPYRPSDAPSCSSPGNGEYLASNGNCAYGFPTNVTFDLGSVTVPDKIIYGIVYNTSGYGPNPYGYSTACAQSSEGCGYDSLNVALSSTQSPSVGTDPLPGSDFLDSSWSGAYCDNGANGTRSLRWDSVTQVTDGDPSYLGCVANTDSPAGNPDPSKNNDYYIPAVQFVAYAVPTITGVDPTSGPIAGGTTVTVTGTNFTGASAVDFGTSAATSFSVVSDTQITATTPAGTAGPTGVSVTTVGGTATDSGGFTYVTPPTITGVDPTSGPIAGGTTVTVTGTNFTGASAVDFGTSAATSFSVVSDTQITATTPAGTAGPTGVSVTTVGGTATDSGGFTYVCQAPVITSAASDSVTAGRAMTSFLVTTCSTVPPVIKETGLPNGLRLVDNGNGTATISGTPGVTDIARIHTVIITATVAHETRAAQSFLVALDRAPVFKSKKYTATAGVAFTFPVTSLGGYPVPAITTSSSLPAGVTLLDNGNGTATLGGTVGPTGGGVYPITITVHNSVATVNQAFVLTVDQAPSIFVPASISVTDGVAVAPSENVTYSGFPAPRLEAIGLPQGLRLVNNGNGTATISGTPEATDVARIHMITITASSRAGTATPKTFPMTVQS
jgi:hypothetical protein